MATASVLPFPHLPAPPVPSAAQVLRALLRLRYRAKIQRLEVDSLRHLRSRAHRLLNKLADQPFAAHRRGQAAAQHEAAGARLADLRAARAAMAQALSALAPHIDATLTFTQKCDALNINPADRRDLAEATPFLDLVFLHALEDSASRRRQPFHDAPLFNLALHSAMAALSTPQGRLASDALFEPGGPLEGVPSYSMQPDGTLKRNPPRLRLVPCHQDS